MKQTWRWFGPHDTVTTNDMSQAGVQGVVTALHHLPNGAIWSVDEIQKRQAQIGRFKDNTASGLGWDVVESLPVSEDIKRQSGDWREHIENYKTSLRNLASCHVHTVCYNFMPVLDWTRTALRHTFANGTTCMRFDEVDFAVFDIHLLKRPGAIDEFSAQVVNAAGDRFHAMNDAQCKELVANIVCGLPGAEQGYSLDEVGQQLALYEHVSETTLRQHQIDFLSEVAPVAEELGMRLCCHPDDPPFTLLGLPRVMSTEEDYRALMQAVDSIANGITLCSGSLGVLASNDLPGMMNRLGDRVHFVHLRNVLRESDRGDRSFHESAHLAGSTDMVLLIQAILQEEQRRKLNGRADSSIPFRPDHGQDILSDLGNNGQPGYPAVGRLKGLAELRGIMTALSHDSM